MLYSCAQFSRVNESSLTIDDVCPKLGNGMKIELKKDFDTENNKFMETYLLHTSKNSIVYNVISETSQSYIKFNPIKQEIETGGTLEKNKKYKGLIFGRKNKDYDTQLNRLLDGMKSFDNTSWVYFNLNDVIECVEKGRVIEEDVLF